MRISDWSSDVCSSDLLTSLFCVIPGRHRPCPDLELKPRRHSILRLIACRLARRCMRMNVDEAGCRDEAACVDHAPALERRLADRGNPVAVDRAIAHGHEPRLAWKRVGEGKGWSGREE